MKPYNTRNVAVGTVKKSIEKVLCIWFSKMFAMFGLKTTLAKFQISPFNKIFVLIFSVCNYLKMNLNIRMMI